MPNRRRRMKKSKFVTKRGLPFQLMKFAEAKFVLKSLSLTMASPPTFANQTLKLTEIASGTNQAERVGNEIQLSGVFLNYDMQSAIASARGRIILYSPRQVTSTALPATDMTTIPDTDRFIIWVDRKVYCGSQAGNGTGLGSIKFKWKPYMKLRYDGEAAGTITQGVVYCVFITAVNGGIILNTNSKTFFKDV